MKAETATKIVMLFSAYYPNDAWKIEGNAGQRTAGAMYNLFRKYDDELVLEAVKNVLDTSDTIPSIPAIRKEIKRLVNMPKQFTAGPPELESSITKERIQAIQRKAMERKRSMDTEKDDYRLDPAIAAYARSKFPGISDKLIYDNLMEFATARNEREQADGNPVVLRMDNGIVYQVVFVKGDKQ